MSTSHVEIDHPNQTHAVGQIRKRPWWFAACGVLLVVVGMVAIMAAFWATLATVLFFAVLLLIAGVGQIADATATRKEPGFGWRLGIGILTALVGGLIVFDPVGGAIGLTLLIAIFFIFEGVLRLVLASQLIGGGKSWFIASGVLDFVLGLLIAIQWPASGVWVIGLFLGIDLMLLGMAMLLLSAHRSKSLSTWPAT
ncbi:MAG: DUF308 domain-containing protein [Pirellulaceae bacterium]